MICKITKFCITLVLNTKKNKRFNTMDGHEKKEVVPKKKKELSFQEKK